MNFYFLNEHNCLPGKIKLILNRCSKYMNPNHTRVCILFLFYSFSVIEIEFLGRWICFFLAHSSCNILNFISKNINSIKAYIVNVLRNKKKTNTLCSYCERLIKCYNFCNPYTHILLIWERKMDMVYIYAQYQILLSKWFHTDICINQTLMTK